jgi:hypothetical protein
MDLLQRGGTARVGLPPGPDPRRGGRKNEPGRGQVAKASASWPPRTDRAVVAVSTVCTRGTSTPSSVTVLALPAGKPGAIGPDPAGPMATGLWARAAGMLVWKLPGTAPAGMFTWRGDPRQGAPELLGHDGPGQQHAEAENAG